MSAPSSSIGCHCDSLYAWAHRNNDALTRHTPLRVSNPAKWTLRGWRLARSAQNRCPTCIVICNAVKAFHPDLVRVQAIQLRVSVATPQLRITVETFRDGGEADTDFFLSLPAEYQGYNPFPPEVLRPPQQPRKACLAANTDETIDRIKAWVADCIQDHPTCKIGGFVPRRLLKVGPASPTSTDSIRLIETRPDMAAPFIALSHCWGQTPHCLTTKTNYAQRQAGIPLHELCKTFQDAVWLTRRLGGRYLWIDSLCILQDDVDDWDREAVTMFRLYGSAYLTIAAAHGADGDAGILYDKSGAQQLLEIDLPTTGNGSRAVTVVITPRIRQNRKSWVHYLYGTANNRPDNPSEPLLGRGWAFQERALSTRIVHFTSEELVWECREKRRCECGYITQDQDASATPLTALMGSLPRRLLTCDDDEDEYTVETHSHSTVTRELPKRHQTLSELSERFTDIRDRGSLWWEFVSTYTSLKLTKPTDRGPAFAGIAQSFGTIMADAEDTTLGKYCAGLWQKDLPFSLFWSCATEPFAQPSTSRRIKDAMAPSWSWYSVAGPCRHLDSEANAPRSSLWYAFFRGVQNHELEIGYEFVPATAGGTAFGRLRRAELVLGSSIFGAIWVVVASRQTSSGSFTPHSATESPLSGFCQIMLLADDPDDSHIEGEIVCLPLYRGEHTLRVAWEEPPVLREVYRRKVRSNESRSDDGTDYYYESRSDDETDYDYDEQFEAELEWCEHSPRDTNLHDCKEHVFGLALVRVPGEDGVYRRIGLFHAEGAGCPADFGQSDPPVLQDEQIPPPSGFEEEWGECIQDWDKITLI